MFKTGLKWANAAAAIFPSVKLSRGVTFDSQLDYDV